MINTYLSSASLVSWQLLSGKNKNARLQNDTDVFKVEACLKQRNSDRLGDGQLI